VRTEWILERLGLVGAATVGTGILGAAAGMGGSAAVLAAVVAIGGVAAAVGWSRLAYDRWRVQLADRALVLQHGVIWHTLSTVPYARLQHVDVSRGPFERMLGLARVQLHTASADTDGAIPGLDQALADQVRDLLLARAGTTDAV
jgi:membrane protein YdbS with pleckstrin-like domain